MGAKINRRDFFRGAFGVFDSQRPDVQYEDWHGHKLDRKLLELLKAH